MSSAEDKQCKQCLTSRKSHRGPWAFLHKLRVHPEKDIHLNSKEYEFFSYLPLNFSYHFYKILQNLITKRYLALVWLHVHKTGNTARRSNWRTGLERSEATRLARGWNRTNVDIKRSFHCIFITPCWRRTNLISVGLSWNVVMRDFSGPESCISYMYQYHTSHKKWGREHRRSPCNILKIYRVYPYTSLSLFRRGVSQNFQPPRVSLRLPLYYSIGVDPIYF